ncbi:hypothetical protein ACFL5O_05060 [Myxococcota bacterium]
MKTSWMVLAVAGSLCFGSEASGKGKGKPRSAGDLIRGTFGALDTNKDGKLTHSELRAGFGSDFKQLDLNRDGTATTAEAVAVRQRSRQQKKARLFALRDKNRDGRLTKAEAQMSDKKFKRLDTGKDGSLTLAEASAPSPKKSKRTPSKRFRRLDSNQDGKVTLREANAVADGLFRLVDKNKDGVVVWQETVTRRVGRAVVRTKRKGQTQGTNAGDKRK